jgi:hypothetical protein
MIRSVSQRLRALARTSVIRYGCMTVLSVVLLYGLLGFFLLPSIIQSQAKQFVAEKFHRNLSIEKVEINPFTLQATIRNLKLMEPQGDKIFLGFEALTVKVSPQSVFRLAPVVKEVLLNKPTLHLLRRDPNHYNFDDIIAALATPNPAATSVPQQASRFSVNNIQLEDGRIEFEDLPVSATQVVSELKLGIPFISSLPSQVEIFVEPSLSAKINGALLQLNGKARPYAEPREASLALDLDNIDLTRYLEYLPFRPRFKLPSAKLDIHLNANFQQSRDKAAALLLSGTTKLKSLIVTDMHDKQALNLSQLQVTLENSDVFGERFNVSHVLLEGLTADLVRERGGQLNLQQMLEIGDQAQAETAPAKTPAAVVPAPASKPDVSPAQAFQLTVDDVQIRNAAVHYMDQQVAQAVSADVEKFDLTVEHTNLDLGRRKVTVGEISSNNASFMLNLGKKAASSSNTPVASSNANAGSKLKKTSTHTNKVPPEDKQTYTVDIDKFDIDNWQAHVEDHSLAQPVVTDFGPVKLSVQGVSSSANALSTIDLRAAINHRGQLAINGKMGLQPLHSELELDVKGVDLLGLQPYVTDQVNLLLTSANLSAKGQLKLDRGNDNALSGGFKGSLNLNNVATVDKLTSDDFLRWRALAFSGVDIKLAPLAINIDQIALSDFYARVIIDPTGHINLQDIARSNPADGKSLTNDAGGSSTATSAPVAQPSKSNKAAPAPANSAPAASAQKNSPTPIKIGKLIMQGGKVRYTDNFIKPHYTANLMNLGGSVSGLSSDVNSRANVDLHGQVNDAPLTIAGAINPLKSDLSLDIKADVKGMELAPLSPYSGRYIGYGIEKGKLSFEVAYQIEQRKLSAQNRLILDQLTFGDKIDSPVATKLPVQFAVALLQDRNGMIDVNLPIGGSLDDPDFSVGGIVFKLIVNVITNAITEPFALLGSLFGGGHEMSNLAFDSGNAVITPSGEDKLKALATALNERPALKLEITGISDPDSDRSGLQQAALTSKLVAIKAKDQGAHGTLDTMGNITVTPEEYPVLLKRAYQAETFTKPRNALGLAKDLPVGDMEKLMLANLSVSGDDLTSLANRRSLAAKEWLLTNGKVPAERLFIMASKSGASAAADGKKAAPARVDFSLR